MADNQYLGIIQRECGQLTHQVENVLYLAGLEKGDYQLRKEPLDLRVLIGEVVDGMELQIREKSATIKVSQPESPCIVEGDAFHIGNTFRNLLDNALKYSGKTPKVDIGFAQGPSGWQVHFADSGIGLTAKEKRKVFQKYQRCDTALCSGEKGFGLGLAYVKKIMEMHNGNIAVRSEKGSGIQFDLYFPDNHQH